MTRLFDMYLEAHERLARERAQRLRCQPHPRGAKDTTFPRAPVTCRAHASSAIRRGSSMSDRA